MVTRYCRLGNNNKTTESLMLDLQKVFQKAVKSERSKSKRLFRAYRMNLNKNKVLCGKFGRLKVKRLNRIAKELELLL